MTDDSSQGDGDGLGACIGRGASAQVFLMADGRHVLKLFGADIAASVAAQEFGAARLATAMGLPVAAPVRRCVRQGCEGIVFERADGQPLLRRYGRRPLHMLRVLGSLARLQAEVHQGVVAGRKDVRCQLDVLRGQIEAAPLGPAVRRAALARLAQLPQGDRLCHGDLHPANVLVGMDGRLTLLDWARATAGTPAGDVARTLMLIRFGQRGQHAQRRPLWDTGRDWAAAWYRRCYAGATGMEARAIDAWALPVAAAWCGMGPASLQPAFMRWLERLAGESRGMP